MATPDLTELERWFLGRGIPHFIADYNHSTRVWTRALPFLLVTYLLAAVPVTADTWSDGAVEFAATVVCLLVAWVLLNLVRKQPFFSRPTRIGKVELGVYVLGPPLGHVLLGEPTGAAIAFGIQLALLTGAYVVASYALIPLLGWTLQRSVDSLRVAGTAMARALPLLLLVVTFFFMTAEVWQVFGRLQGVPYGLTLMLFLVSGAAFAANRGRKELDGAANVHDRDEMAELVAGTPAADACRRLSDEAFASEPPPLTGRQRINLLLVIVVNQVLLAVVVATAIGGFFLAFGFLGIGGDVVEAWVLHPPNPLFTWTISSRPLVFSEELIRVSGFLATFSGFYFSVQSTTDPRLREGLDEFAEDNVRQLLAMRQVYLADRE
ncbi:MAG: hypothetical protein K1X38_11080 [Microthrixaceae bacterium]|nr:hypothetical protein [Microthrixaceae bacterium]